MRRIRYRAAAQVAAVHAFEQRVDLAGFVGVFEVCEAVDFERGAVGVAFDAEQRVVEPVHQFRQMAVHDAERLQQRHVGGEFVAVELARHEFRVRLHEVQRAIDVGAVAIGEAGQGVALVVAERDQERQFG